MAKIHLQFKPNTEQLETLVAYAEWAGEGWKRQLNHDWMRAGSKFPGEYAYLQQVRNQGGPKWLVAFELPSKIAHGHAAFADYCTLAR
jgi:hypothetical protein